MSDVNCIRLFYQVWTENDENGANQPDLDELEAACEKVQYVCNLNICMFFDEHSVKLSYQKCPKKSSNNSPIQRKKNSIIFITTILITSTWSTSNQVPGCSVHCTPGPSERCIKYTEFSAGKLAYTSR